MPPPSARDTRYLEQKNGKWRVSVAVPRVLHQKLGTRLKRELGTDSLALANRLKWQVVSELRDLIAKSDTASTGKPVRRGLIAEALEMAASRARITSEDELEQFDDHVRDRADDLRGDPVEVEADLSGAPIYVYDEAREETAGQFAAVAQGRATPIGLHHEQFISQGHTKPRTQADDRRALRFLTEWCEAHRVPTTLQAITRKVAVRFMDDLHGIAGGQSPVTLNKYLNRLSRYWQWLLEPRGLVEANVWHRLKIAPPKVAHDEQERPFTDKEVAKLLAGNATPHMHDLMRIGALTGARLDVIVDLKLVDCRDGLFVFKPQKKEPKPRTVPIHSALVDIVARRSEGRPEDAPLFPEWPAPSDPQSLRERSFKASNAFTAYRRQVGVDHVIPGKRRSLVNFHSFRRWFITKAEQADQPESIIAAVVGYKRQGMTLGRYSAGPLMEQARRCVEAVKLPVYLEVECA